MKCRICETLNFPGFEGFTFLHLLLKGLTCKLSVGLLLQERGISRKLG